MVPLSVIHQAVDGAIHAFAISLNLCLIVVICKTQNEMLKRYKSMFLLTSGLDLVCALITFIAQPAFFVNGDLAVMISNGFFSNGPPGYILAMLVAYNTMMAVNMAFLPVPFVYRYWNMCIDDSTKWLLPKLCAIPTAVTLVSVYTSYNLLSADSSFQSDAASMLATLSWTENKDAIAAERLFGFRIGLADLSMMPHIGLVGLVQAVGYACIIWSEYCVFRKMNIAAGLMRKSTQRLQSGLHKALIALAVCPAVSSLVPVGSFLVALILKINLISISPFLLIFVSSITVVNPITTCYFVKSFRDAFVRLLCFARIVKRMKSTGDFEVTKVTVF